MLEKDIREYVVRPTLKLIDCWSQSAENLIMATGMTETTYSALKQVNGPALGFWQMEPATYLDHLKWLESGLNQVFLHKILLAIRKAELPREPDSLIWDMQYATIMCRVHYLRIKEALPDATSAEDLCAYYLKYYNTALGKASHDKCFPHFVRACNGF